jgi:PelA/Pel-15E family pectate lyase
MSPHSAALAFASVMFLSGLAPASAVPQAPLRPPGERADIIVAQDGSGDFRAIQPALDSIARDNGAHRIILVRNGVYREKLYVTASHISLVGEDRDATRIEYAELRKAVPALSAFITPAPSAAPASRPLTWSLCLEQPPAWYGSAEAVRVADQVLLYQRRTGGWPKNIDMARTLSGTERQAIETAKGDIDSTIDNGATTTQLRFLALVYSATRTRRFRAAFDAGFDYLLAAQYPNGGWPQFFPLRDDYSRHITFNDDAMVRVMEVLRDAAGGVAPFTFVDAQRRVRAGKAVERGLALILKAQVRVNGRLTVWCAQHDEATLAPAKARTYEHPSLAGSESVGVLRFLMSIPNPSVEVVAAVEAGVAWLRDVRLTGLRVDTRPDASRPGGFDRAVVKDAAAPPIWARFYEIGTNRPIFSGRDSIVRDDMAAIEHERRVNYAWYGYWPGELLAREYPEWRKRR